MQVDGNRFDNLISDDPHILTYVMALHILLLFYTLYVTWGGNGPKSPQLCLLCAGGQVHKELGGVHHQVDEDLFYDPSIFVGKMQL